MWQNLSTAPLLPCANVSWAGLSQQLLASSSTKEKDTWEVCTALCWGHSLILWEEGAAELLMSLPAVGTYVTWLVAWRQHLLSHCWEIPAWCRQGMWEGSLLPKWCNQEISFVLYVIKVWWVFLYFWEKTVKHLDLTFAEVKAFAARQPGGLDLVSSWHLPSKNLQVQMQMCSQKFLLEGESLCLATCS